MSLNCLIIAAIFVAVDEPPIQSGAQRFVERAEAELELLSELVERAKYHKEIDETDEHIRLHEAAGAIAKKRRVEFVRQAVQFDGQKLPGEITRKLARMKLAETLPAPSDPAASRKLSSIVAGIESSYTRATAGLTQPPSRKKAELYRVMQESRDTKELLEAWSEYNAHARSFRPQYQEMVKLANDGASELNYKDVGVLWRSHYDMAPDEFLKEYERLWSQIQPLYEALHCHVRAKLREKYGAIVPEKGPIPAHLLGDMWAQSWTGINSLVTPGDALSAIDVTARLREKGYTPYKMVHTGEGFFMSLGFPRLPSEFWERSLFSQPVGRTVNPQPSAWPIDPKHGDVRLKMLIETNQDDFNTIHHELGHVYYYLACKDQPFLFQDGANPAFHEALGDAVALSITPDYLKTIGLLDEVPRADDDLPFLFRTALEKIPQLATAIVVDMWRWKVFSGEIPPGNYNAGWWELRRKYQGVSEPIDRTEADFDAGMFFHIANNVPYDRYFVASILQFDIHRALCEKAGHTGSLHRGSIYGNRAAGESLQRALAHGASQPWQDTMYELAGRRNIEASSIVEYFRPVMNWLAKQNEGRTSGW
ncbi:M2 family metallopeptidase [Singulisphaera sp. Ch08]|uniref:M2 family metallopeptidase n=1 Tax=Singulisphaera sp. Ch08 TaxID=3120278 RepID=A0AAU7C958_9BACT